MQSDDKNHLAPLLHDLWFGELEDDFWVSSRVTVIERVPLFVDSCRRADQLKPLAQSIAQSLRQVLHISAINFLLLTLKVTFKPLAQSIAQSLR
jgi:hypothetical protein